MKKHSISDNYIRKSDFDKLCTDEQKANKKIVVSDEAYMFAEQGERIMKSIDKLGRATIR